MTLTDTQWAVMATGFVFLAPDRIVTHLATIARAATATMPEPLTVQVSEPATPAEGRSIEDITRDIDRLPVGRVPAMELTAVEDRTPASTPRGLG